MFLKNTWYVAAWSHEVSSTTLFSRTILNTPVVLWRDGDGAVVALQDRCPHRARRCPRAASKMARCAACITG